MLNSLAGRIRRATVSGDKDKHSIAAGDALHPRLGGITSAPTTPGVRTAPTYFSSAPPPVTGSRLSGSGSTVHLLYDTNEPPPQSHGTTRFVCISDTHSQTFEVPDGDILLHSGDLSSCGKKEELNHTLQWLARLPHKLKIIIAGNHDLPLHKDWYELNYERWKPHRDDKEDSDEILALMRSPTVQAAGIVYLQDELYEFQLYEGGHVWSVYGSPWQPYFGNWAFNYHPGDEASAIASQIPPCDILLTHGPPEHTLDLAFHGRHEGCPKLAERVSILRPRLHVFGHIHEDHGAIIRSWAPTPSPPLRFNLTPNSLPAPGHARNRTFDLLSESPLRAIDRLRRKTLLAQNRNRSDEDEDDTYGSEGDHRRFKKETYPDSIPHSTPPLSPLSTSFPSTSYPSSNTSPMISPISSYPPPYPQGTIVPGTDAGRSGTGTRHGKNMDRREETVFVNGANAPTGPRARDKSGVQVPFGCRPFQPVIVDLAN
ncbi:hypothetical protein BS47DRAFT_1350532 [Hydnum rufescens UP504]|uniref:Calcineurin-like phosphoesterase domain-containing protein n=1 Tax=Hydnum rufescens UP504 TaxID=1448309 RepID=A0A9P6DRE3_9AGAM|nr:hypothetical protein BS47DRAFT_1350532 [Hydnum rufescens UP504]